MLSLDEYVELLIFKYGAYKGRPPRQRGGQKGRRQTKHKGQKRLYNKRYYKRNRAKIKRKNKKWYHRVCKKKKRCRDRRKLHKERPKYYERRRRAGDILLYDQGNPANNEIKQPGKDVGYRAQSPLHYVHSPDEKEGLPKGNDLPDKHVDNVPSGTSRVVPNGQFVTYNEDIRTSRMDKRGARIEDLLRNTGQNIIARASEVEISPKRFIPEKGFWSFSAKGSQKSHTVRIKGLGMNQGNIQSLNKATVKVSCTCEFFKWQGPEHWAKKEGYLYGKQRGSASTPRIKDPEGNHRVCKHIVAAFNMSEGYVVKPSVSRVAARYIENLERNLYSMRREHESITKPKTKI